ncbi:MAG TPA: T9SS type A sorting domain-containing protein [Flavobacterium sp.]|nr:T9SS type A sorting domain-containing protein [Flavobacterium sp.]
MDIEEVTVYDMSGKTVNLQKGNKENEMQLNIESFATGNYLLHIKTEQGTAVKKVIKN